MQIHLYCQDVSFLVLFFFRLVGTYRTSIFECLIGKDNTLLIGSCVETSHLVKNILPIENILPLISFPWASFEVFFINSVIACSGLHKYEIRYVSIAYTPVTNCKFISDFKSFKITVLHGPMFTSHGFRLYNIETFFSTHPNALPYCSVVTPHSSKISDSVILDRSLIVTL